MRDKRNPGDNVVPFRRNRVDNRSRQQSQEIADELREQAAIDSLHDALRLTLVRLSPGSDLRPGISMFCDAVADHATIDRIG